MVASRLRLKCDGTRAETRFRLSAKRTSPVNTLNAELNPICHLLALLRAHHILHVGRIRVKSAGASVQSTTGSRGVRISGSNAGYTMFRGSLKGTGYSLHSPVSPSPPHPCVTVCHHVSTGLYQLTYTTLRFPLKRADVHPHCYVGFLICYHKGLSTFSIQEPVTQRVIIRVASLGVHLTGALLATLDLHNTTCCHITKLL